MSSLKSRPLCAAAAVLALSILAACDPGTTGASPSPTVRVSTQAVPSSSPEASPSLDVEAEAERVYRAYFEANDEVEHNGGARDVPPTVRKYVTNPWLSDLRDIYRVGLKEGIRTSGTIKIVTVQALEVPREGAEASLEVCQDGSRVRVLQGDKVIRRGGYRQFDIDLKTVQGDLKIFRSQSTEVKQCEG